MRIIIEDASTDELSNIFGNKSNHKHEDDITFLHENVNHLRESLSIAQNALSDKTEMLYQSQTSLIAKERELALFKLANPNETNRDDILSSFSQICKHLLAGEKIAAIKAIRSMTGCGLKEAKDTSEGITPDESMRARALLRADDNNSY
jgi:ribosomal protein L7/L12